MKWRENGTNCACQKTKKNSVQWKICTIKGTVQSDFASAFSEWVLPKPLNQVLKAFRIWFWIPGNIRDFDWLPAIVYSKESILPYCLLWRVATHSRELQMYKLFTETLGCHLIWRVETPCIVQYSKSLLSSSFAAGSHCWKWGAVFKKNWRTPPALKEKFKWKINYACRALFNRNISKVSKIWVF